MPVTVTQDVFGQTKDGKDVMRFTLSSSNGRLVVRILDYGGIITEINVPDREGNVDDVNLGFDDMAGYNSNTNYMGALIGRVANRIKNGSFTLDEHTYSLYVNNGPNSLHGGKFGFDQKMWSSKVEGDSLVLQYVSPDGEENYQGELTTTVTYRVTDDNQLVIQYAATTTKSTPVNLTNHAYFNLAGHAAGTIDDHWVTIPADQFLPVDTDCLVTGETLEVEGTEWDLRKPVKLGDRLSAVPGGTGFDTNFCLRPGRGVPVLAARVEHPASGRYLECLTTEPGMQFYTSAFLNVPNAKGGKAYKRFGAFCLEAQHYPDSVNQPSFPNIILKPGDTYRQTTIYKFGII